HLRPDDRAGRVPGVGDRAQRLALRHAPLADRRGPRHRPQRAARDRPAGRPRREEGHARGAARLPAAADVGGARAPADRPGHRIGGRAGPASRDGEDRTRRAGRVRCEGREPRGQPRRARGRRIARSARNPLRAHEIVRRADMAEYKGIIDPPIDELLTKVDSKYQLVIFAAKRARQINDYYADLHEGSLFDNVGPLVDSTIDDKPLSVALHEINEDKLVLTPLAE